MLRGHLARANTQWRHLDGADVLVIFTPTNGYVSPSWYPSKADNPRVVPTWNYEVVHAHGRVVVHNDSQWTAELVRELTDHHERRGSASTRSIARGRSTTRRRRTSASNCARSSGSRSSSTGSRASANSARTDRTRTNSGWFGVSARLERRPPRAWLMRCGCRWPTPIGDRQPAARSAVEPGGKLTAMMIAAAR